MMAYASASGAVMFVPEKLERTIPRVSVRVCNDNRDDE